MPLLRKVSIENYKSIRKLTLELGQVNVLIGANGSGKSNLLEAIVLGAAAARDKLDHEYLAPRGIRVTEARFMRSAFPNSEEDPIVVSLQPQDGSAQHLSIDPDHMFARSPHFSVFVASPKFEDIAIKAFLDELRKLAPDADPKIRQAWALGTDEQRTNVLWDRMREAVRASLLPDFIIYAPENSALRIFQAEPQILPLGIKGEGLFAHLKVLNAPEHADRIAKIVDHLALFDWFERFEIPKDLAPGERSLLIRDRYLAEGALFDQRSANEGFLFLLFYLTLFISPETPSFFAIDNIDASLNPKLVTTLIEQIVKLAEEHNKQVILTTHNPAVLDGLDLGKDEQRLFVTERGKDGATKARRVRAPKPLDGEPPLKLSEAFVRGYLGGLPKNF